MPLVRWRDPAGVGDGGSGADSLQQGVRCPGQRLERPAKVRFASRPFRRGQGSAWSDHQPSGQGGITAGTPRAASLPDSVNRACWSPRLRACPIKLVEGDYALTKGGLHLHRQGDGGPPALLPAEPGNRFGSVGQGKGRQHCVAGLGLDLVDPSRPTAISWPLARVGWSWQQPNWANHYSETKEG
jgi:hypothetical protein